MHIRDSERENVHIVIYGAREGAGVIAAFDIGRLVFNDTTLDVKEYNIQDDWNNEYFQQGDEAWWLSRITIKGIVDGDIDDIRSMLNNQAITLVNDHLLTKVIPGASRTSPTLRIHDFSIN